jgi:hypothetical protein
VTLLDNYYLCLWHVWSLTFWIDEGEKEGNFREIEFFSEADTLESSSILIYSHLKQENIYTEGLAECRVD